MKHFDKRKLGKFQSTLPLRGATIGQFQLVVLTAISIHAPLAGSDSKTVQKAYACFVTNAHFIKLNSQGSHLTRLLNTRFGRNSLLI